MSSLLPVASLALRKCMGHFRVKINIGMCHARLEVTKSEQIRPDPSKKNAVGGV